MSTNTYVALKTVTVSGSSTTSINFDLTGISGYTDLVLVMNAAISDGYCLMRVNSDSGTTYSRTQMSGNGSAASSVRTSNDTAWYPVLGTTTFSSITTIHLQNYSNTTTYKTALQRGNDANSITQASVWLWRGALNAAITSIDLIRPTTNNFLADSTFSVYGIANADVGAYATGGVITQDANYYYHAFGSSSTFTPTRNLTADILVVAGGGGGGATQAGGGGAGGVLAFASQSLTSGTGYSCTVGSGGAGASTSARASSGSNSQFASLTASVGGGGGGSYYSSGTSSIIDGGAGGSGGGGGSTTNVSIPGIGGTGTSGQGYAGGNGNSDNATYRSGGGGGGAGGAGGNYSSIGGAGGLGTTTVTNFSNLSSALIATGLGVNGYLASGGAGGGNTRGIATNGGGSGGDGTYMPGNGAASTGSGGGGGGYSASNSGGNGGSGLIIVRYAK